MQNTDPVPTEQPELPDSFDELRRAPSIESLTELAYRRAREALETALEEARKIRLDALEDVRRDRAQETSAVAKVLERQREAGETEIRRLLRQAEIEAERVRSEAQQDARDIVRVAKAEAQQEILEADRTLVEARALRIAADERQREVERVEAEFNATISQIAERLGLADKPARGWLRRLGRRDRQ